MNVESEKSAHKVPRDKENGVSASARVHRASPKRSRGPESVRGSSRGRGAGH